MAPLHRSSQLFSQMRSGGRISERLLLCKRANMTSDNSHPQRLAVSDATAQYGGAKANRGKMLFYCTLVAETNCQLKSITVIEV